MVRQQWRSPAFRCQILFLIFIVGACSCSAQTIWDIIQSATNLTILASAASASGLQNLLADPTQNLTLFAPTNSAFLSALQYGTFTCTADYYDTTLCSSQQQFLGSSDLRLLLSNLVVQGGLSYRSLQNGTTLNFLGAAAQQVFVASETQKWLGNAPLSNNQYQASNGYIFLVGTYPLGDLSMNSTAIYGAALTGDYGPFTAIQRTQLAGSQLTLPTDLSGLKQSYRRVRADIDLPQGGLANPMAISYDPTSMYRLFKSSPVYGYQDSEASAPSPGNDPDADDNNDDDNDPMDLISAAPLTSPQTLSTQSETTSRQAPAPGTVQSASIQASTVRLPGVGESGVLAGTCTSNSSKWNHSLPDGVKRPADNDTLAFMTVLQLASLYKANLVTSMELVEIFTARLKRYDYVLEAVVTYTTDLARKQAQAADQAFARGIYLGPLHGIPYGLKDIMSVSGYPTTWGAPQFRNQYINEDSNVYKRLTAAGAVLVAKLATGEMAYDDVWFGGMTKNPWNILEGSSGSSAGPTASVVAGNVPFSVGSETEGSLMSPASVCGASAMRPSLGSIGRSFVMTLADSLDKIGPICRSIQDCAVIFDVLRGKDDLDPSSRDAQLIDPSTIDVSKLTVGYLSNVQTAAPEVLNVLRLKGVTLKPFKINHTTNAEDIIKNIMITETAAHFDYWQRSGQDTQNIRQDYWPPLLRLARTIPAVEYIQAQRARSLLAVQVMQAMRDAGIDAFIANSTTELAMCNLVGIPTVSVPIGFSNVTTVTNDTRQNPSTIGFFGWPNGEPEIMALGVAWQNATTYHLRRPPIDNVAPQILNRCIPQSRCSLPSNGTSPAPAPKIIVSTQGSTVADSG